MPFALQAHVDVSTRQELLGFGVERHVGLLMNSREVQALNGLEFAVVGIALVVDWLKRDGASLAQENHILDDMVGERNSLLCHLLEFLAQIPEINALIRFLIK